MWLVSCYQRPDRLRNSQPPGTLPTGTRLLSRSIRPSTAPALHLEAQMPNLLLLALTTREPLRSPRQPGI